MESEISNTDLSLKNCKQGHNVNKQFRIIPYLSNYYNIIEFAKQIEEGHVVDIKVKHNYLRLENEVMLKKYFETRKVTALHNLRRGSIMSNTSENGLHGKEIIEQLIENTNLPINNSILYEEDKTGIKADMIDVTAADSYMKYYDKLNFINLRGWDIMNRHTLWIPSFNNQFRDLLLYNRRHESYNPKKQTSILSIEGEDYIPSVFDSFSGSTSIPSILSSFKLPSLSYHCSVEMDDEVFILGGVFPSYRYDEEAPSIDDFEVDGVPNLPPPLLPNIINNPSFLPNPFFYVINAATSSVRIKHTTGNIPPPMICVTGTKLTDRYILFYGGMEIKTETKYLEISHRFIIKKRAFLNNAGYILDTLTFRFTRIDITAAQSKDQKFSQFYPRFGHSQVSVTTNDASPHAVPNTNVVQNLKYETSLKKSQSTTSLKGNFAKEKDKKRGMKAFSTMNDESDIGVSLSNTILIFGGYRQTGVENYEPLKDLWKIQIPILARGKSGFCTFGDSVVAKCVNSCRVHGTCRDHDRNSNISVCTCDDNIKDNEFAPSERAFMAYCLYTSVPGSTYTNFEVDLLENLRNNFKVCLTDPLPPKSQEDNEDKNSNVLNSNVPNLTSLMDSNLKTGQTIHAPQRTLVIHGGSNKYKVYGDMWWFDIDKEKWTKIETYIKTKSFDSTEGVSNCPGVIPMEIKVVGHTMNNIGHVVTIGGGMLQQDIDELYEYDDPTNLLNKISKFGGVPLGCYMFRTFDLITQFIINRVAIFSELDTNHEVPLVNTDSSLKHNLMMMVGATFTKVSGKYVIIGGISARRTNITDLYLRGTLLNLIIPVMSLSS